MDELGMTKLRFNLLESLLDVWCDNLNLDANIEYFESRKLISDGDVRIIRNEPTTSLQRYRFIKLLQKSDSEAYANFYRALIHTEQRNLAILLENGLDVKEKLVLDIHDQNYRHGCKGDLKEIAYPTLDRHLETPFMLSNEFLETYVCKKNTIKELTSNSIAKNEDFYRVFDSMRVKEPRGILDDLDVDYIDSTDEQLTKFDENIVYPNFSTPRGFALIINNRYFNSMPERLGTDIDVLNLNKLLHQLGYKVVTSNNLRAEEILHCAKEFARLPGLKYVDSCIVSVLTHGGDSEIFGIDEIGIPVLDFVAHFNSQNCPSLAHKPKIFFLQACRGNRYDHGAYQQVDRSDGFFDHLVFCGTASPKTRCVNKKLPTDADILISYATTPGYVSWRNSLKGSWFVQSVCEVFAKHACKLDILTMLTMVNKQVAEAFETAPGSYIQVPDYSCRFRRLFYFYPGLHTPQ